MAPYIADHAIPPLRASFDCSGSIVCDLPCGMWMLELVSPIPPDLRKLQKPVHTRLTPASAGVPGNDISDIEMIREEWMRRTVQDELFARSEKAGLK